MPRNLDPNVVSDQLQSSAASLKHAEVLLTESALQRHHGNLSKADIALGISRPTLYRKIQTHGIRTP